MIFETSNLLIRRATISDTDVDLFYRLWTDPKVMTFVGFPRGLKITSEEIRNNIAKADDSEYDKKLLIELKDSHQLIGEYKLGLPDDEGISETDVKLLPKFWSQGFGTEVKQGLVNYLFTHTDCKGVKATPNKANLASQKMQEAVGGRRVGEYVYNFPVNMREYTVDVPCYIYIVYREVWERRQSPHP